MNGMTIIVKTISSWVKILIFLFGIYIILYGHISPGGGFAGGVIFGSMPTYRTYSLGLYRVSTFSFCQMAELPTSLRSIPTNEGELIVEEVTPEHMILKYIERNN